MPAKLLELTGPYGGAVCLCLPLILLVLILHFAAGERFDLTISEMLIRIVVVVGMSIFISNSGVISFGHIAFMCIGAYAAAWATCDPSFKEVALSGLPDFLRTRQYPFEIVVIASGVVSAATALIIGAVIIRLSGVAAAIATFAFLVVVKSVYSNWDSVTAGGGTIVGIPTVENPLIIIVFAVLTVFVAAAFQKSRYGLMLRASRDDAVAAKAAAVDIVRVRLIAFILSAFVVGVGGALYAHLLGVLVVDVFFLPLTFTVLAMLVVGGIGSLTGAVVGVVVVTLIAEGLRALEGGIKVGSVLLHLPLGAQAIGLGAFTCLILVLRPNGLVGGTDKRWPWTWWRPLVPSAQGQREKAAATTDLA
jgi:branched-chain amino acid transport system permease protein